MNLITNILATGFLMCLLATNSLTESQGNCFRYRLESSSLIYLDKENFSRNLLQFNFEFLWKPYKAIKNAYTLHLRNSEIVIGRENPPGRVNVGECASNIIPATRATQAALIVFDDNGVLQEIKVQSNEPELVVNVRLYLTSVFQFNRTLLGGEKIKGSIKVNGTTDELTYVGKCPVSYDVARENSKAGDNLRILKTTNVNECSSVVNTGLEGTTVSITEATKVKGALIPQVITYNSTMTYNPWPKSNWRTHLDIHARIMSQDSVACEAVPSFIDSDTITITRQHLRPIDDKLLFAWNSENRDLNDIYRALAAGGSATNIYQDVYERALKCWQQIN